MAGAWYEPFIDAETWRNAWDAWDPSWSVDDVRGQVETFVGALARSREHLAAARPRLRTPEDRAAWDRHHATYARLVAPLLADSDQPTAPAFELGALPAVAVVLAVSVGTISLALGAWAVAWAVSNVAEAVSTESAIDLWARDLEVRWEAAQKGLSLPATTLPGRVPDPSQPELVVHTPGGGDGDGGGGLLVLLGLGALAAGAAFLAPKLSSSR